MALHDNYLFTNHPASSLPQILSHMLLEGWDWACIPPFENLSQLPASGFEHTSVQEIFTEWKNSLTISVKKKIQWIEVLQYSTG